MYACAADPRAGTKSKQEADPTRRVSRRKVAEGGPRKEGKERKHKSRRIRIKQKEKERTGQQIENQNDKRKKEKGPPEVAKIAARASRKE